MRRGGPIARRTPLAAKRKARTSDETRARQLVAARSGGRCEVDPRDAATDWSHRVARSRGGAWCPSNGVHLCARHHAETHAEPERARDLGLHVRTGRIPALVPVRLAAGWVLLRADGGMAPVDEAAA
jgi:hypothetical protein